jgi:hypothetical protein
MGGGGADAARLIARNVSVPLGYSKKANPGAGL